MEGKIAWDLRFRRDLLDVEAIDLVNLLSLPDKVYLYSWTERM